MTARFERHGVAFEYPENWQLDEEQDSDARLAVTLYTPGGAFWSLRIENAPIAPRQLVDSVLSAMREEYKDADVEDVTQRIEDQELIGVDMNFFCLDLTNTIKIRAMRRAGLGSCLILFQAEDRELARLEPVFWAVTTSLLRET
jgi:hypothetical protein